MPISFSRLSQACNSPTCHRQQIATPPIHSIVVGRHPCPLHSRPYDTAVPYILGRKITTPAPFIHGLLIDITTLSFKVRRSSPLSPLFISLAAWKSQA
ncbi:hypothetical protein KSP40_PGU021902 [Platanthera guangdongensis]|uniref:Uncharacterized protein n=1 Tax=Platanthera guangdongensis TaxID=2320717 RepID=A0ABR2LUU8_9ASPA